MIEGNFIHLKGKVQPRKWSDNGELEFKVNAMELLGEMRDKARLLEVKMELDDISEGLVERMVQLADENQGNCKLRFTVIDRKEKFKLHLPSRSVKVKLTSEFIGGLEAMDGGGVSR